MTNQEIWDEGERKWRLTWNANEETLSARHKQERLDFKERKRIDWNRMRNEIYQKQKAEKEKGKVIDL